MYKVLLADNEGVVLDALSQMIYLRFGETCDIRTARTARHLRALARKFLPDIAVINVQMPGLHGFDVVREMRAYHRNCVFITVTSYGKAAYQSEARSLNIFRHLKKPLYRDTFLPVFEAAVAKVALARKHKKRSLRIQADFDAAVSVLEQDLIGCLFFRDGLSDILPRYLELLNLPQPYGRLVTLTFGELPEKAEKEKKEGALQNQIGSAVHLHIRYPRFRETVREHFPLAVIGPVMGNRVLFLLPHWREAETPRERGEFLSALQALCEQLEAAIGRLAFFASYDPILPMAECGRGLRREHPET